MNTTMHGSIVECSAVLYEVVAGSGVVDVTSAHGYPIGFKSKPAG